MHCGKCVSFKSNTVGHVDTPLPPVKRWKRTPQAPRHTRKRALACDELLAKGRGMSDEEEVEEEENPDDPIANLLSLLSKAQEEEDDSIDEVSSTGTVILSAPPPLAFVYHPVKQEVKDEPFDVPPAAQVFEWTEEDEEMLNQSIFEFRRTTRSRELENLSFIISDEIENGMPDFYPLASWPVSLRMKMMDPQAKRADRYALFVFFVFNGVAPWVAKRWITLWHRYDRDRQFVNPESDCVKHAQELFEDYQRGPGESRMYSCYYYCMDRRKYVNDWRGKE